MVLFLRFNLYSEGASLVAQSVKNLPANAGSIPGLGRFPGEGNGNPLQYTYLGNPMDRGAWQATVQGVIKVRHDLVTKSPPLLLSDPDNS